MHTNFRLNLWFNKHDKLMCKYPNNVQIRKTYHNSKINCKFMTKKNIRMQKEKEFKKLDTLGERRLREKLKIINSFTNNQPEIDSFSEIPSNGWLRLLSSYKSLVYDETLITEPNIENQNI